MIRRLPAHPRPLGALWLLAALLCVLGAGPAYAVKAPEGLGGIRLGTKIQECLDRCDLSRAFSSRDNPGMLETDAVPVAGFRSGDIYFGDCADKGVIARVSFRLTDGSREFFEKLLREYRKVFGKPDEYRGDPFHAVITWKWSFKNDKGESISLMLTNSRDDDYKLGTFIKLTNRTLWDREAACWREKNPPLPPRTPGGSDKDKLDPDDLTPFIPK